MEVFLNQVFFFKFVVLFYEFSDPESKSLYVKIQGWKKNILWGGCKLVASLFFQMMGRICVDFFWHQFVVSGVIFRRTMVVGGIGAAQTNQETSADWR